MAVLVLFGLGATPKVASATENLMKNYVYDGYEITFSVVSKWDYAFDAELKITNTGDETINDWALQFEYDKEILYTWDGTILDHTVNSYIVKNNDWNANIKPGECASFGMMVQREGDVVFPDNFSFVMTKEVVDVQNYAVEFALYSDWGTGSNSAIILSNLGDESIEDWQLEFDYGRKIENISNAEIVSYEQGHYIIKNAEYNADIAANSSVHIGIVTGEGDAKESPTNFTMCQTIVGNATSEIVVKSEDLKKQWYETRYYPINPKSEEWLEYGLEEMLDVLNPPEELLHSFSTEELAKLMMEYPYLWILTSYEYDKLDYFFDFVEANCSVYNELMSREEGIECLLKEYQKSDFDAKLYNEDPYMVWGYNPMANAEVFGCQLLVRIAGNSDIDKEESELYTQIKNEKAELYAALDNNIAKSYLSFDNIISEDDSDTELLTISEPILFATRAADGFTATGAVCSKDIYGVSINFTPGIYRKYGVSSSCYQWASGDYDEETRQRLDNSVAFPWYRLSRSSPKYNCHGYAWLNANASNGYWLEPPLAYTGAVTYVGYNESVQVGDIVVMYNASTGAIAHSAVICQTPSGATGDYTISKCSGGPLYKAPLSQLMKYYSCSNYDVYRID